MGIEPAALWSEDQYSNHQSTPARDTQISFKFKVSNIKTCALTTTKTCMFKTLNLFIFYLSLLYSNNIPFLRQMMGSGVMSRKKCKGRAPLNPEEFAYLSWAHMEW